MPRTLTLWTILACLYGGFLLWHTPLRAPLTEAEVSARLQTLTDSELGTVEADQREMLDFFLSDDGKSFYMVNLNSLRETALYPDGSDQGSRSGAEADSLYGAAVIPELLKRGSYPVFVAKRLTVFSDTMGGDVAGFERIGIVRYRSRRDLLEMITSDRFGDAVIHKFASLSENLTAPSAPIFALNLHAVVLILLLTTGSLGTLWTSRKPRFVPQAQSAIPR